MMSTGLLVTAPTGHSRTSCYTTNPSARVRFTKTRNSGNIWLVTSLTAPGLGGAIRSSAPVPIRRSRVLGKCLVMLRG